jgi:spermidine synthase
MASYNGASERAAVCRALEHLAPPQGIRILMGGLGVGYSLREALDSPRVSAVTVVEIEPAVIRWNRSHLAGVNGGALDDPRVELIGGAFEAFLRAAAARARTAAAGWRRYHAVMVDTDNGSTWLSRDENAAIYSAAGLRLIRDCLLPGGAACFWCARREAAFEKRLKRAFGSFIYETVPEETGQEGSFYLGVYLGVRP